MASLKATNGELQNFCHSKVLEAVAAGLDFGWFLAFDSSWQRSTGFLGVGFGCSVIKMLLFHFIYYAFYGIYDVRMF